MKGTYLKIGVGGHCIATSTENPPVLEKLKEGIGGGYLEVVPLFTHIHYGVELRKCVAFCDEDGKHKGLPLNYVATKLWERALSRLGHPGLEGPDGRMRDWLVGDILVVFGDREWMDAL